MIAHHTHQRGAASVAAPRVHPMVGRDTMMRQIIRFRRGYSLLEVLLTVSLLGLLLFAVGDSISHVLDATVLGEGRQNVSRSSDELASRLGEEARSSTAVFVPSSDVLGQPNTLGQEVDLFRKASDGTTAFVAYRFDAPSGTVSRYEYIPGSGGPPQIVHQDQMAENVGSFAAAKVAPGSIAGIVGGNNVNPVNVYYGSPELVGGNGIVTVAVDAGVTGEPQRHFDIHLSSRAAPTDVSILVSSASPTPSPGPSSSPVTVGFFILAPFHPAHGPNHGGDPGNPGHGPGGVPGSAVFYGLGSGQGDTWFELTSQFGSVENGVYPVRNSDGSTVTVVIGCNGSPCPRFIPLPVATSGNLVDFQPR